MASKLQLNSEQKKRLSSDIKLILNAQKGRARKLRNQIAALTPPQINTKQFYKKINQLYIDIALDFTPILSKYLVELDQEQQEDFFEELQKDNKKIAEQVDENDSDDYAEQFEFFFGDLNKPQIAIIESHVDTYKYLGLQRVKKRKDIQARMRVILRDKPKNSVKILENLFNQHNQKRKNFSPARLKSLSAFEQIMLKSDSDQIKTLASKKKMILEFIDQYINYQY
jgi:hypothetical protein